MPLSRTRMPRRLALTATLALILLALSAARASADDCVALGGALVSGECQVSAAVTASDALHGGVPFVLNETLRITGSGSITIPPAAGASLTIKITGDFILDAPTATGRSRIIGDVSTATAIGATITIDASGSILLNGSGAAGARISSDQTGGSCAGGGGGNITLTAGTTVTTEKGSRITSVAKCPGGEIIITAGLGATIEGVVLSEGTSTLGRGGPITITGGCELTIGDSGEVVSKGRDPGADLVHLEGGCSVLIHGLVSSTGPGHRTPLQNRCNPPDRPGKPDEAPACVEVWSGGTIIVDRAAHTGEIDVDTAASGGTRCCAWIDLFAAGDIKILGSATSAVFAVHANQMVTNAFGGLITIVSTEGHVAASGRAIQANATTGGGHGGTVTIDAKHDVTLDDAVISAKGDATPTYGFGGLVEVRSYGSAVTWANVPGGLAASGDVQPTGDGVAAANRGAIDCPDDIYNTAQVTATNDASPSNNKSGPVKIDVDKYYGW